MVGTTDTHQHLWPRELVDRLRARSRTPYLRGWTLHVDGQPPQQVDPLDHDVPSRVEADRGDGVGTAWLALCPFLGASTELLDAWHEGVGGLGPHHRAWASVLLADPDPDPDPDLDRLAERLAAGFVGVQLPAAALRSPAGWEAVAEVLSVAEAYDRPVLVHPGGHLSPAPLEQLPGWWSTVVDDTTQLQAAWWAWHAAGVRERFGSLRVVFAAGAGLAPVLHERRSTAGGERTTVDPDLFGDTASCGPQALDALVRALGIDVLVAGSDRPQATSASCRTLERTLDRALGAAASHAVRTVNPARLLAGRTARTAAPGVDQRPHPTTREERTWQRAS